MRKRMLKLMSLLTTASILTGCGATSAASLPYELTKSTYEVYQESMAAAEYANTRESGTQQYEYHDVTNADTKSKLTGMVDRIEAAFTGAPDAMTDLLIDDATYENVKYMLDRYTLTRTEVAAVKNASDLYVVDVNYKATRAPQLSIPAGADMVGIEGFYAQSYANSEEWVADDKFGIIVTAGMNDYCVKNVVMYQFSYDLGDHRIIMTPGTPTAITVVYGAGTTAGASVMQDVTDAGFDPTDFIHGDDEGEFDYTTCDLNDNGLTDLDELRDFCAAWEIESGEETGAQAAFTYPDADGDNEVTEEEMQAVLDEISAKGFPADYTMVYAVRDSAPSSLEQDLAGIDVDYDDYVAWVDTLNTSGIASNVALDMPVKSEFIPEEEQITFPVLAVNTIVGAMVAGYASANTDIFEPGVTYSLGGRGFFGNSGTTGLNIFDSAFTGTGADVTIRYYIKDTPDGLKLVSMLPTDVVSDASVKTWKDADGLMLTDEIKKQAQDTLYSLDRVLCNEDLAGVSGGDIVLNKAYAGLMCYGRIGTVISDYTTTLDAIVAYDEASQVYLCRCNRQYCIGGMTTGCTGKYSELVFIAMQMTPAGMRVIDELPITTKMMSEPYIEPTPLADLVADSLPNYSETVPTETQDIINGILSEYYTACNAHLMSIGSEEAAKEYGTTVGIRDIYSVSERLFTQDQADLGVSRMKNYLTINGGGTVSPSDTVYQGGTSVLVDVILTETFNYDSAATPVIEKVHYTFVQDNGRWRVCGMEVLETNQTTFADVDAEGHQEDKATDETVSEN